MVLVLKLKREIKIHLYLKLLYILNSKLSK